MDIVLVFLIGFIIITCIVIIAIIVSVYVDHLGSIRQSGKLAGEQAQASYTIIRRAMKQAHAMIVRAELTGIQTVAKKKIQADAFEETFEKELTKLLGAALHNVEYANASLTKGYQEYLLQARKCFESEILEHRHRLAQSFELVEETTVKTYRDFFEEQKKLVSEELSAQMKKTEERIEDHRKKREYLQDNVLADLVVRTAKLVIKDGVSMESHAKLIIDSLEEARKQGVLKPD